MARALWGFEFVGGRVARALRDLEFVGAPFFGVWKGGAFIAVFLTWAREIKPRTRPRHGDRQGRGTWQDLKSSASSNKTYNMTFYTQSNQLKINQTYDTNRIVRILE